MFRPCNPSQSVQRTATAHFFLPDRRFLMRPQRPTNQIILTRPLSLKLCNPGFELNQVAVGERKRTLCDFSLGLTPKGTNLPHVLYPSGSLWADYKMSLLWRNIFFSSSIRQMKVKCRRWSVADICSFLPSVNAADCLDVCDECWEIPSSFSPVGSAPVSFLFAIFIPAICVSVVWEFLLYKILLLWGDLRTEGYSDSLLLAQSVLLVCPLRRYDA